MNMQTQLLTLARCGALLCATALLGACSTTETIKATYSYTDDLGVMQTGTYSANYDDSGNSVVRSVSEFKGSQNSLPLGAKVSVAATAVKTNDTFCEFMGDKTTLRSQCGWTEAEVQTGVQAYLAEIISMFVAPSAEAVRKLPPAPNASNCENYEAKKKNLKEDCDNRSYELTCPSTCPADQAPTLITASNSTRLVCVCGKANPPKLPTCGEGMFETSGKDGKVDSVCVPAELPPLEMTKMQDDLMKNLNAPACRLVYSMVLHAYTCM